MSDNGEMAIEKDGWTWESGWHTLVPSLHTLADAQYRLGQSSGKSQLANGVTYDFLGGKVRITILEGSAYIAKIWIVAQADLLHANIEEARSSLGTLKLVRVDRSYGAIYERPGLRICADPSSDPQRILWAEIFKP